MTAKTFHPSLHDTDNHTKTPCLPSINGVDSYRALGCGRGCRGIESISTTAKAPCLTLGSLFDGAGGFPLAGVLAGFTPVWASEIEPFPVRVTTRRFPNMKHLGDIRRINGAKIDPADVITFGSPCQDLSIANGSRQGLDGERSGLFREAVRIIKEMKEATNGSSPTFIIWENVVGAFSSNSGEDFRQVLEAIAQIADGKAVIPRPENGQWPYAGEIVGDTYSIAYRVYDAQFWGVPQRRRRIYLVADFRGKRAGKIQFERERLLGDFAPGGGQREKAAGKVTDSTAATGTEAIALRMRAGCEGGGKGALLQIEKSGTLATNNDQYIFYPLKQSANAELPLIFEPGVVCRFGRTVKDDGISGTLRANMGDNLPVVVEPVVYALSSKESNGWKSANPNSGFYITDKARTLDTNGCYPACNQGGNIVLDVDPYRAIAIENHPQDSRVKLSADVVQTLTDTMGAGGNNGPMVLCIQGNTIDRSLSAGANGKGVSEDVSFCLNTRDRHAVAYQKVTGTLCAGDCKGIGNQYVASDKLILEPSYRVRRLTPLECCRLQGFPDFWTTGLATPNPTEAEISWWSDIFEIHRLATDPTKRPKTRRQIIKWLTNPYSDGAEYKMWGNSLAVPCAYTILAGVAEELLSERKERRPL